MATMSPKGGGGPSKMATEAMCMWDTWSSIWRNDASSGLRRSGPIATLPSSILPGAQGTPGSFRLPGSADGCGRERLAQCGEGGRGENQLARLLVRRLDDLWAPVLGHGAQPHGVARPRARLQADHQDPGLVEPGDLAFHAGVGGPPEPAVRPVGAPVGRRHGGNDNHDVESFGPEDVRVGGRVHAAVDVLGAPDV